MARKLTRVGVLGAVSAALMLVMAGPAAAAEVKVNFLDVEHYSGHQGQRRLPHPEVLKDLKCTSSSSRRATCQGAMC